MEFVLASKNKHKITEFERILTPLGIGLICPDIGEIEETGTTFIENARIKALAAMEITGKPSIADDSGLEIDALDGRPGVYSARYAGENAADRDRINKVLREMEGVTDRTARFVCAICCVFEDGTEITAIGTCEGEIAYEPAGENGFGYDPVFVIGTGRTFAELTDREKDEISHRGKALCEFNEKLQMASGKRRINNHCEKH